MMNSFKMLVVWLYVVVIAAVCYAVDGPFVIKNDKLEFPDGSSFATAPRDGRSVLSGSGTPGMLTGNIGDFYLDTSNYGMYGPYNGTWGTGVSLIGPQGPQGPKGDTGDQGAIGPQGPVGTCSGVVCQGGVPTVKRYMTYASSMVIPNEATTNLRRILEYFPYNPSGPGNITGLASNNLGVQFVDGTTDGLAVFYFLKYDFASGTIDLSFTPIKVGGGRWFMTTINGVDALLVNTSAISHAMPRAMYYTVHNGNLTRGYVLSGPAAPVPQSASFSPEMLVGKTGKIEMFNGIVTVQLAAGGTATIYAPDGRQSMGTWSVVGGKLVVNTITFKIIGGTESPWTVTYTDSRFTLPETELGPMTLELF